MIPLRSPALTVRIEPRHGGEILDLLDAASGQQLLGRPPFAATEPVAGDLDESTWTAAYRGGWQLLTPNAGNACVAAGARHGFRGAASNSPWRVCAADTISVTLRWHGHGLQVERQRELALDALAVSVAITATSERVPFIIVEHIALGRAFLDPVAGIDLPGDRAFEMSEIHGPVHPPADATAWPNVRRLDGTLERHDRWPLERACSRLLCVADLPGGQATIQNSARNLGLRLSWDADWLPHLWIWRELRTTGGPWREQSEMLVIEPASVPHHLGLDAALANQQAYWPEPGAVCRYRLHARPFAPSLETTDQAGIHHNQKEER